MEAKNELNHEPDSHFSLPIFSKTEFSDSLLVEKNIELSSEFSRYVFEHPEIEDKLPSDAEIVFLPEYDSELSEHNLNPTKDLELPEQRWFMFGLRD